MKKLLTAIVVIVLCVTAFAGKPTKPSTTIPAGWNEVTFGGYNWAQNGPQVNFRPYVVGGHNNYSTAFYVTNAVASLTTNSVITIQFTITGNSVGWMAGGQFSFAPYRAPNVRLYFSRTSQKYSNTRPGTNDFFSEVMTAWIMMPTNTMTVTLSSRMDLSSWRAGNNFAPDGGTLSQAELVAGFYNAISHIEVIGLSFGGHFYDTGVAYTNGGPATLTLNNFYMQVQ